MATFYKWRAKYGGMDVSMMSRMNAQAHPNGEQVANRDFHFFKDER